MLWSKKKARTEPDNKALQDKRNKGLVLFDTVEEAIRAEKLVKRSGYACALVAPPPQLRKGCDIALEINLIEQPAIERTLQAVPYKEVVCLEGSTQLLDIVQVFEYPEHTMVKAGNMKLTYETGSGLIVNTSGGGCPDIPYLHIAMLGKRLDEIPRPRDVGHTLCALMLDRAVEGALEIWKKGDGI